MAIKIEKIQHGCQMVAFHKMAAKPRHFALFLIKTVHYYLDFFTCLDLYCIHINCITLEV